MYFSVQRLPFLINDNSNSGAQNLVRKHVSTMVKLNTDLIAKSSIKTRKQRDESLALYLKKLTHLYFSEKNIDQIVSKILFLFFMLITVEF